MKKRPAVIAALIITLLIGLTMAAIGASALLNTNATAIANSSTTTPNSTGASTSDQQQIQQYQAREVQYQTELQLAAQQLSQANQQVQNYEQIITQLQQAGLIPVSQSGQFTINLQGRTGNNRGGGPFGGN